MTEYNNQALTEELIEFIHASPSRYHAIAEIARRLDEAGFIRLTENDTWSLDAGHGYYVIRAQSSLIAFRTPESGKYIGYNISASHSDSPCFKLKETSECTRAQYIGVNTEQYGGSILSTWLDRPLSVAGRLVCHTEDGIKTHLVNVDRDLLLIPNVAPHMNRQINAGYEYNLAVDMLPLFGTDKAVGELDRIIAEAAGVDADSIIGSDLYLYNRTAASIWGANAEFFSSRSIDDLQCAYTSLRGFISAKPRENCAVYCCFDNEEVGSATKQGAASTFLYDTLHRIAADDGEEQFRIRLASSFLLSCDNAHAIHPNHPEYSDRQNYPVMGGGVVLKFNANQRYTTDGVSAAFIDHLCRGNNIPLQHYANRSDIVGGSTLGSIATTRVSVNSADVGLAQLAMHSSYETAGVNDNAAMAQLNEAFFSSGLIAEGGNSYRFG